MSAAASASVVMAEGDIRRLQEVKDLATEMTGDDGKCPVAQLQKTLEAFYEAQAQGVEWKDTNLSDDEYFDTACQTALLFKFIFEKHAVNTQKVLVFLGATGTGKSTTLGIVQGAPVVERPTGKFDEDGDPITDFGLEGAAHHEVGQNATVSATLLPKCMGSVKALPGWTLWDFPGFEDTRSKAFNIGIAEGYKMMCSSAERCCLLMCVGSSALAKAELEPTIARVKAVVPAPADSRCSKAFVSLNYSVRNTQKEQDLHNALKRKLTDHGILFEKISLDKLAKSDGPRDRYIQALKGYLDKADSAIDPATLHYYTKTMTEYDVTAYVRNLNNRFRGNDKGVEYSKKVLEYTGISDLAASFKDKSLFCGPAFETDCADIKDFDKLKDACQKVLNSYQTQDEACKSQINKVKGKLSWSHVQDSNAHYHIFAEAPEVDEKLSSVVRSKDIELILPINKIEFETILTACENQFRKILSDRLDQTLEGIQGHLQVLIGKVNDDGLKQKFEDLKDDLEKMSTNVKLKPIEDVDPVETWADNAVTVETVSTVLLSTGLALEAVPGMGTVVGTGMMVAGGVMKVTAMLLEQFAKHKGTIEDQKKKEVVLTLKELAQVVKNHCHFLNDSMTLIGSSKDTQSKNNQAMSADKQKIMESLTASAAEAAASS